MMKGFESKISEEYQKFENQEKNGKINFFKLNRFKETPQKIEKTEKSNLKQNTIDNPQNGPIKSYSNNRRMPVGW